MGKKRVGLSQRYGRTGIRTYGVVSSVSHFLEAVCSPPRPLVRSSARRLLDACSSTHDGMSSLRPTLEIRTVLTLGTRIPVPIF